MISAGASPNEIASTSESSSSPNRLPVPVARATRPSSASATPPSTMNDAAPREIAARREHDREDAAEQIEQRESVRQQHHGATHVRRRRDRAATVSSLAGSSAMTVVPATRDVARPSRASSRPAGRKTSTRDPKRMIPIRSPCSHPVALLGCTVTMRRAMRPAICRTRMRFASRLDARPTSARSRGSTFRRRR